LSEQHDNDAELMARTAGGDMAAFAELIKRHQSKVMALALRTLGRQDQAQDVVQDVFIKVYDAAKRYRPSAQFTTWLYRIAVNRCLDLIRRSKHAAVPLEAAESILVRSDAQGDGLERRELISRVRRAVEQLSERQRIVVVLHRYHGLTHEQIAAATGWTRSAVESLLVRAYARLRELLGDLNES